MSEHDAVVVDGADSWRSVVGLLRPHRRRLLAGAAAFFVKDNAWEFVSGLERG